MKETMQDEIMKDKRHNPRLHIDVDVEYNMSCAQSWFHAFLKNINCSGICMITKTKLNSGLFLEICFKLPDSSRIIKLIGEIIWHEHVIDYDYYCSGIKFVNINLNDIELIKKFINNATFDMRDL